MIYTYIYYVIYNASLTSSFAACECDSTMSSWNNPETIVFESFCFWIDNAWTMTMNRWFTAAVFAHKRPDNTVNKIIYKSARWNNDGTQSGRAKLQWVDRPGRLQEPGTSGPEVDGHNLCGPCCTGQWRRGHKSHPEAWGDRRDSKTIAVGLGRQNNDRLQLHNGGICGHARRARRDVDLHPRWCQSEQTVAPDNRGPNNPGRSKSAALARVERHTTPSSSTVMVAIQLDLNNWCSHHTMKHVNSFQRGYSLQMRQVLEGSHYNLTADELSTMVIVNYDNYNVLQLASRFVWWSGYVWASAMPVNVLSALEAKNDENNSHILTALIQGLHNGGTTCFKIMPKHIRDKAIEFLLDRNLATTPANMIPEHSIGHPDHAAWVMTRSDNEIRRLWTKRTRSAVLTTWKSNRRTARTQSTRSMKMDNDDTTSLPTTRQSKDAQRVTMRQRSVQIINNPLYRLEQFCALSKEK